MDPERLSFEDLAKTASIHLYDLNSGVRRLARLCGKQKAAAGLAQVVSAVTQQCGATGGVVAAFLKADASSSTQKQQQAQINAEYTGLARELTELQHRAAELMRSQAETPYRDDEPGPNDEEHASVVQILDQLDQGSVDLHSQLIEERELGIAEIQRGMAEINAIFSDLSTIVQEQGQQLDTVEDNVTDVATETANADRELTRADQYQRSRGKWSCYFLLFLLFVTVVVALVVT